MKVVINACYGGFGLSEAGVMAYAKRKGLTIYPVRGGKFGALFQDYTTVPPESVTPEINWKKSTDEERAAYNEAYSKEHFYDRNIGRDDPDLIAVVEEIGSDVVSGNFGKLKIVEIPDGVDWEIKEYDGFEHVAQKHETWG